MTASDVDVLIVGAGPSGLTLAGVLARRRVPFRIVDRKPGPVGQSRAAIVHCRTLELWDRLGVARRAVDRGVEITTVELLESGRRRGRIPLTGRGVEASGPYRHPIALPQHVTERLLADVVRDAGGAVEFGTEVVEVTPARAGPSALLRMGDGRLERCRTRWIVGADGARSTVRHASGIGFTGSTYEQTGLLADVRIDVVDIAPDVLRLNLVRGGFVGLLPLGANFYRLFGAVPRELITQSTPVQMSHDPYASVDPAVLQAWLRDYFFLDTQLGDVAWSALFRVHSRLADRLMSDNVFLLGDAAHIHSPAGGQGMNLGVGDAFNLGWKLAAVADGSAHPALLDSYQDERMSVARTVLRGADRGFAAEVATSSMAVWLRAHVLSRVLGPLSRVPAVRHAVFRLLSQTWIRYPDSPIVGGAGVGRAGTVRPGDRAPDTRYPQPRGGTLFDALRGLDHDLLAFEGPMPSREPGAHLDEITAVLDRYRLVVTTHPVPSTSRELHEAYGVRRPTVVLIRPDGHIAFAGASSDSAALDAYLGRHFVSVSRPG